MHPSVLAFAAAALGPAEVTARTVIEAGSFNVNGSVREHVEALQPALYIGTDMRPGPGVDVVCRAEDLPERFTPESADVVISTELLEHAPDWQAAMTGMIGVLKEGGLLVLTTRGPGFPQHGYPDDFHRFPVPVMRRILDAAALEVEVCVPDTDPASPGVFVAARKPAGWAWPPGMLLDWDNAGVEGV